MDDASTLGTARGRRIVACSGIRPRAGTEPRSRRPYSAAMPWARRAAVASRYWLPSTGRRDRFLADAPTARRGPPSPSASGRPGGPGLSILVARRRDGARRRRPARPAVPGGRARGVRRRSGSSGWPTDDPGRVGVAGRGHAPRTPGGSSRVRPAPALLPGRPAARRPGGAGSRPRWWCGCQPGRRRVRGRAVPGAAGGPGPPVRSHPRSWPELSRCSVRPAAPALRRLRGVPGAAVPPRRPHPAPADQVAGPGRDRACRSTRCSACSRS